MLINRKKVKEFALEMAKHRAHKFTGSAGVLRQVRRQPRTFIRNRPQPPSKGKTIT